MDDRTRNLLYRNPPLYEAVYHSEHVEAGGGCVRLFDRYAGSFPKTILDIGCGTGCEVLQFSGLGADCVGVDIQEPMVEYARTRNPGVPFHVADMRRVRLGRIFEAVVSLGGVLANLHTNDDLDRAFGTFAAHCAPNAVLLLELFNPFGVELGVLPGEFTIDLPDVRAKAAAAYTMDRSLQMVTRTRSWTFANGERIDDFVLFRMVYPKEIERYLTAHGFTLLGFHDTSGSAAADFTAPTVIVTARFGRTGKVA